MSRLFQIRPFFLVFFAAFLLRILHFIFFQFTWDFEPELNDGQYFINLANALLLGVNISSETLAGISPAYVGFLFFIHKILGPALFWPRLIQIILGSGVCAGLYQITKDLFGKRAGWIAGALSVFCGIFIYFDTVLLKPCLVNALIVFTLWTFGKIWREEKNSWLFAILGGAAWLTACMLRMQLVVVLPWLIWVWAGHQNKKRQALMGILIFFLAMTMTQITWNKWFKSEIASIRNAPSFEEISAPQAGIHFYVGNYAEANGTYRRVPGIRPSVMGHSMDARKIAEESEKRPLNAQEMNIFWLKRGFQEMQEDWPRWVMLEIKKFFLIWNAYEIPNNHNYDFWRKFSPILSLPLISYGLLAPLGFWGWVHLNRDKRPMVLFLEGFAIFYILALLLTFVAADYRLPLHLIWIIFSAFAMDRIVEGFKEKKTADLRKGIVFLTLFFLFCNYPTYLNRQAYDRSMQARYDKICKITPCR